MGAVAKRSLAGLLAVLAGSLIIVTNQRVFAEVGVIRLSNGTLEIGFESTNGALVEFKDLHNGHDFVESGAPNSALWEIEATGGGENKFSLNATRAKAFTWERTKAGRETNAVFQPGDALRLTWGDFGTEAPPGLRVTAVVAVERKRPLSAWNISVDGFAGLPGSRVHFPRVPQISRQENERLAVPVWLGQETSDPRRLFSSPGQGKRMEWPYPGQISLQCLAFYAEGGPGLYVSCDDASVFRKAFAFFGDGRGNIGCDFVHVPQQAGISGGRWTLPYHAVLGTFAGDWVTAAEGYREWATNQQWAAESRLHKGEVPDWVLNTGMWVWNRGRSPGVLTPAIALQKKLGLPVSVFWHWWHGCSYDTGFPEYLPPREGAEAFKTALAAAHTNEIHALVYMNQRLWGTTTKSWTEENAERFAVKDRNGKTYVETYNSFTKAPCASMCLGTEFWRDKYAGLAERAVHELRVDGIYMDQACASLVCYDATHGHPVGPGTYWMDGFHTLTKEIRDGCGTVTLAGEGCGEAWLPWLDLMLCLQVSKERYSAPDGWEPIPFFQAVYHAHAVTYGNYSSLTMPPYDDLWPAEFAPKEPLKLLDRKFSRQFLLEQARAFVWGQQPTVANFLPNQLEERPEETDYMMRLAKLRSGAEKYLLRGTFLRPPELHAPEATLDISRLSIYAGQKGGLTVFQKQCPVAVAGAWRAPDGDVAVALASITKEPTVLSLGLDPAYYGLRAGGTIYRTDETGRKEIGKIPNKSGLIQVTLPGDGACLLEFTGAR